MEHYIKEASIKHPSYLQDTPHFLWVVQIFNSGPNLPDNSCLVTADILGAYANIPQDYGSQCLHEVLEEREEEEKHSHNIYSETNGPSTKIQYFWIPRSAAMEASVWSSYGN